MKVTRQSAISKKFHTMELPITLEKLNKWNEGTNELARDFFPELNSDEREFLISGIPPEEWDDMFGKS